MKGGPRAACSQGWLDGTGADATVKGNQRTGDASAAASTLDLKPLQSRQSLREDVAHALRAAIVAGSLRPDSTYSVPMLAGRFGVSPTPVREAILDLAKEGLVSIVKNKGFRVKALSERDLDEITQIRELLEIPVVADQTGRLSEPQVRELRRLADNIVSAAGRGDLVAYIESDNAFHLTLLHAAGNQRLVETVADLRNHTRLYGLDALVESGGLVDSANEHLELIELIAGGDREAVVGLMRHHLRHVRGIWAARRED
ncbi:GntR family transcriptional regulator [Micromonospora aurantiaca]|uniref:GntR family transcriptional regulator n=2 Tax=Micromonospora aurantiaca (nom. illeg.) TaxID=47850 RepID=A0A6N3K5L1_9ACTN|nr:GntR family transcriptional regulator [Micromonospora aurantiaca]MBC9000371.1 GntR family transcriptional regulator [Micromonospora aurantiaca]